MCVSFSQPVPSPSEFTQSVWVFDQLLEVWGQGLVSIFRAGAETRSAKARSGSCPLRFAVDQCVTWRQGVSLWVHRIKYACGPEKMEKGALWAHIPLLRPLSSPLLAPATLFLSVLIP